jgi:hypothetical protein
MGANVTTLSTVAATQGGVNISALLFTAKEAADEFVDNATEDGENLSTAEEDVFKTTSGGLVYRFHVLLNFLQERMPEDNYPLYRDWQHASKGFHTFIDVWEDLARAATRLMLYSVKYSHPLSVGAPFHAPIEDVHAMLQSRVHTVYRELVMLKTVLAKLHQVWLHFLLTGEVQSEIVLADMLSMIQLTGDGLVLDVEVRAINVLNYFIRKWTQLAMHIEFMLLIDALHSGDAAEVQRQTVEVGKYLTRTAAQAARKHVIMSDQLIEEYARELKWKEEEWRDSLPPTNAARQPCIVFITSHGKLVENPGDPLPTTVAVPNNASIVRIVTTPPGYVNLTNTVQVNDIFSKIKSLYLQTQRLHPSDVLAVLAEHTPRTLRTDMFTVGVEGNVDTQFAVRYLPGQAYLNKTFLCTKAEQDEAKATHSVDSSITVLVHNKQVDMMPRAPVDASPDMVVGLTLEQVVRNAVAVQLHGHPGEVADVYIIDLSCSPFPVWETKKKQGRTREEETAGYLGYESDPERQRRTRTLIASRLTGGNRA